jgi:hypothetical protein
VDLPPPLKLRRAGWRSEKEVCRRADLPVPVALGGAGLLNSPLPTHAAFSNQFTRKSEISGE